MKDNTEATWARGLLHEWKDAATSNCIIYTFGFVSSPFLLIDDDKHKIKKDGSLRLGPAMLLLPFLTIVSLVIQTVIPVAIIATLPTPDGLCPNQAKPLTKFIGLTLCLFFVVLTITMCLGKLRGMGFLKLFCSNDVQSLGCFRFFIDLGILSNMVAMAAAGIAQYLLFIRNAGKDYVSLLLQSLAMQFVLSADEKLMTGSWTAWTKARLGFLMEHDFQNAKEVGEIMGSAVPTEVDGDVQREEIFINEAILKKVRLMNVAETVFLTMVSVVGIGWSISLAYCM